MPVPGNVALSITVVHDVDVLGAHEAVSESLREQRDWVDGNGRAGRDFDQQEKAQTPPGSARKGSRAADCKTLEKVAYNCARAALPWPKRLCRGTAFQCTLM